MSNPNEGDQSPVYDFDCLTSPGFPQEFQNQSRFPEMNFLAPAFAGTSLQPELNEVHQSDSTQSTGIQHPRLTDACQNQTDQLNNKQFMTAGGIHFQETRQPGISQGEPSQYSQQIESESSKANSEDEKKRRLGERQKINSKKYREKKKLAAELVRGLQPAFHGQQSSGQLLAQVTQSSIQQIHHPSFSAPVAGFARDHHETDSGGIDLQTETDCDQIVGALTNLRDNMVAWKTLYMQASSSQISSDAQMGISSNTEGVFSGSHLSMTMDELLQKIKANNKSIADLSDFPGLNNDVLVCFGKYNFPKSLVSTAEKIICKYGDITKNSKMHYSVDERTYIVFCATIKEMDDQKLEEVTEHTILKWGNIIKYALNIEFNVEFAMNHLTEQIVPAYIGQRKGQELGNIALTISKLQEEYVKVEEQYTLHKDATEKFSGKSVSAGLF